MKKLLILGGGYGGMRILQNLFASELPDDLAITLIDREPYHCMKTEYYALAAGTISDCEVRVQFPRHEKLDVVYGEITAIELEDKLVRLQNGDIHHYDELIIGLGCEDRYHNIPGAREHTLSIQTIGHVRETSSALHNVAPNGSVSIVGAGLSGIELASELHESRPDINIRLFDRGERILSGFPPKLGEFIQNWFLEHGVNIINNSNITKVEDRLLYNHDEAIESDVIVWTAGVQPNQLVLDLEAKKDGSGRLVVTDYFHLPNNEDVFVVGDCASSPHSPSAQLAEAQGENIVTVLKSRWNNQPLPELPAIKLKGILGSLGKKQGFGYMGKTSLTGRVPRLLKSGVLWMYKRYNH